MVKNARRELDKQYAAWTGLDVADHPLLWYHEQGFDNLIASSSIRGVIPMDEQQDGERTAFYSAVERDVQR